MNNSSCVICNKHQNLDHHNLIGSSDHWILRASDPDKNLKGYLYLEPRKHVTRFDEIDPAAYSEMGSWIEKGMHYIHKNFSPLKVYLVTISEAVPHIHFHLVPRFQEEIKGLDYLGLTLSGKWNSPIN